MHRRHQNLADTWRVVGQRVGAAIVTAAAMAPSSAMASTSCGQWSGGFAQLSQALGAFSDFFYGPFFKFGSLGALAIAAVMLLMDDSNMGRVAQLVLRAICVIGFIAAVASFITTPTSNCTTAGG